MNNSRIFKILGIFKILSKKIWIYKKFNNKKPKMMIKYKLKMKKKRLKIFPNKQKMKHFWVKEDFNKL